MWLETAIQWRKSAKNYIINGNHICKWNWTICNITRLHIFSKPLIGPNKNELRSFCRPTETCIQLLSGNRKRIVYAMRTTNQSRHLQIASDWTTQPIDLFFLSPLVSFARRVEDDCYVFTNCKYKFVYECECVLDFCCLWLSRSLFVSLPTRICVSLPVYVTHCAIV